MKSARSTLAELVVLKYYKTSRFKLVVLKYQKNSTCIVLHIQIQVRSGVHYEARSQLSRLAALHHTHLDLYSLCVRLLVSCRRAHGLPGAT
jgi:hypothetical protein